MRDSRYIALSFIIGTCCCQYKHTLVFQSLQRPMSDFAPGVLSGPQVFEDCLIVKTSAKLNVRLWSDMLGKLGKLRVNTSLGTASRVLRNSSQTVSYPATV